MWRDISTAPDSGEPFQAWVKRDNTPDGKGWWETDCRINEDGAFEIHGRIDYDEDGYAVYGHLTATHWMPWPEPPSNG